MPIFRLPDEPFFPHPDLAEPDGLLAVGGDLSMERLLQAYQQGIFPWYSGGEPILWWSPDPRMVLFPQESHLSRRLRRVVDSKRYLIRADTAFRTVMEECARIPRRHERGTWIHREMIRAYIELHKSGWAHSVEAWDEDQLAGGLYGVSIGQAFFGESMFSRRSNASKIAFNALVRMCIAWGVGFIDCQFYTEHLSRLGARTIPRNEYLSLLLEAIQAPSRRGFWTQEFEKKLNGADYREPDA